MNRMRWITAIGAVLLATCVDAGVETEGFSATEGYVDGNLDGQNNWVERSAGTFSVDSSGAGSVSVATIAKQYAYFGSNAAGDALDGTGADTLKVETDFSLEVKKPAGNSSSFQLQFSNNGVTARIRLQLFRFSTVGYKLRLIDQLRAVTDSPMISFGDMGMDLEGSDFLSDMLSMSLEITQAEIADEWLANAYLYNGAVLLASITDLRLSSSILYGDSTLFVGMDSGADVCFTSRTVDSFTAAQVNKGVSSESNLISDAEGQGR